MTIEQVYEQTIKPLSSRDKLAIARLIISEIETTEPAAARQDKGFDYLKRILPKIECMTVTDEDLATVKLNGPVLG